MKEIDPEQLGVVKKHKNSLKNDRAKFWEWLPIIYVIIGAIACWGPYYLVFYSDEFPLTRDPFNQLIFLLIGGLIVGSFGLLLARLSKNRDSKLHIALYIFVALTLGILLACISFAACAIAFA